MRWIFLFTLFFWSGGAMADPVRVFAAASLKSALDAVAEAWTEGSVILSYAGSGTVARQVAAGAPADLVILAHTDWMDWLSAQGVLGEARVNIAANDLVVIGPEDAAPLPLSAAALKERLGAQGRLAMGDLRAVPAGLYGMEALQALQLWEVAAHRVAQADNVRTALAFVARREVPLGIVYASDARAEPRVRVVATLPPETHAPILYPAAKTKAARPATADFMRFLLSPSGQAILKNVGLREPPQ